MAILMSKTIQEPIRKFSEDFCIRIAKGKFGKVIVKVKPNWEEG